MAIDRHNEMATCPAQGYEGRMSDSRNPLTPAWRTSLADLALSASCAEADQAADLLRQLHELLLRVPQPWAGERGISAEPGRFTAMLDAGACASAALLLVAGRAGYMVSQGLGGRVMATVTLGGSGGEVSSEGADLALALTGALAEALSRVGQEERPVLRSSTSQRLN